MRLSNLALCFASSLLLSFTHAEETATTIPSATNDVCAFAEPLLVNSTFPLIVVTGDSNSATDDTLPSCSSSSSAFTSTSIATRGLWYSIIGTGDVVAVDTCRSDLDTIVTVLQSPSCDADALTATGTCITTADDTCGLGSYVAWPSQAGLQYYVVVHTFFLSSGVFDLRVQSHGTTGVPNNVCSNAQLLAVGDVVAGTTVGATTVVDPSLQLLPTCRGAGGGTTTTTSTPGVWYTIVGDGNVMTVDTCAGADFRTEIAVYRSSSSTSGSCDNLVSCEAVATSGSGCSRSFDSQSVAWLSVVGETYYVLMHGGAGDFVVTLSSDVPALNGECTAAESLTVGDALFVPGSLVGATRTIETTCGSAIVDPGVWYSVVGDGQVLTMDICSEQSNVYLYTSVFTAAAGSCADLSCLGGGSSDSILCPNAASSSSFSWVSEVGVVYYVLVHGKIGDFTVSISSVPEASNNDCLAAIPMETTAVVDGSTIGAVKSDLVYCGVSSNNAGVWYSVVGDGGVILADTCRRSDFSSLISVYTGSCENLVCIDGSFSNGACSSSYDASSLSWVSAIGETYYILVHGGVGNFTLSTTSVPQQEGDVCQDSLPLIIGTSMNGTTVGTTVDNEEYCGRSTSQPGVWYSVVGDGTSITIDTCEFVQFDSIVSVYSGDCDGLSCVVGEQRGDSCAAGTSFFASSVSWFAMNGTMYQVLVHGGVGDFVLTTSSVMLAANDDCGGATSLLIGGEPVQGTTIGATVDDVDFCGGGFREAGVWFSVIGDGNTITVDTCGGLDFYSTLTVFRGLCESLECIGGSSLGSQCSLSSRSSSVSWASQNQTLYSLLVHGGVGNFTLSASSAPTASNDECNEAELLPIEAKRNGTTTGSTFDDVDTCGTVNSQPGVWYTVVGDGNTITVDTCDFVEFDSRISVFEGDTCNGLTCVGGASSASKCPSQFQSSSVAWISEIGKVYHVLVHNGIGDFTLTVSSVQSVQNDVCTGAVLSQIGELLEGSTVGASSEAESLTSSSCAPTPGVWYKFIGDGNVTIVDTCGGADFSSRLSVFSGSCLGLRCIDQSADSSFCPEGTPITASAISWMSQPGEDYFVLVHGGFGSGSGGFNLSSTSVSVADNNECATAQNIAIDDRIQGSSLGATVDDVDSCEVVSSRPGVWYTVIGNGDTLTALCAVPTFDCRVSVYSGICLSPTCVSGSFRCDACDDFSADASSVSWVSIKDEIYHVHVHGGIGSFNFSVSSTPTAPNNDCSSAIPLVLGDTILSSTAGSTVDADAPSCGITSSGLGVWFSITGNGDTMTVDTCSGANFDSHITVYDGTCEDYGCIDGTSMKASCGPSASFDTASVSWKSAVGEVYRIRVHGGVGQFNLTVTSAPTVANDVCEAATDAAIGSIVNGSTIGASGKTLDSCGPSISEPGTWFTLLGDGNSILVDTCQNVEGFSSSISVFEGACGEQACVGGSSFGCGSLNSLGSSFWFPSKMGTTYNVLVHGGIGIFSLQASPVVRPDNDSCNTATLISSQSTVASSEFAIESQIDDCEGGQRETEGLWYKIMGDGDSMTIDTCGSATAIDTRLALYAGSSCGDLLCLSSDDDSCGFQSSITWDSVLGQMYYVFVYGFLSETGTIELSVDRVF